MAMTSITLHKNDLPAGLAFGPSVAIDTETLGLNVNRDRLCLVQLSSGDGSAHLKLGAAYPAADAFDASPAVRALACAGSANASAWRTAAALVASTCAEGVSLGRPPR